MKIKANHLLLFLGAAGVAYLIMRSRTAAASPSAPFVQFVKRPPLFDPNTDYNISTGMPSAPFGGGVQFVKRPPLFDPNKKYIF